MLINDFYDDSSFSIESNMSQAGQSFLHTMYSQQEIIIILKNHNLPLQYRTELIKFYRMVYIDVAVDARKIVKYRQIFCDLNEPEIDFAITTGDEKSNMFLENLMNISDQDKGDKTFNINESLTFNILYNELISFNEIIDNCDVKKPSIFKNYLENGIILPVKLYLGKTYMSVHNIPGKDFLKIYEMACQIIKVKEFILKIEDKAIRKNGQPTNGFYKTLKEMNINDDDDENGNQFNIEEQLENCKRDYELMISDDFRAFDYSVVYERLDTYINSIILKPKSKLLKSYESKNMSTDEVVSFEERLKKFGLLQNVAERTILRIIMKYESDKKNFQNGSLIHNLEEIHQGYDVSYRNLYLKYLFNILTFEIIRSDLNNPNDIILDMLYNDTDGTQAVVKQLYKEGNLINFDVLTNNFFIDCVSVILNAYNPSTLNLNNFYDSSYKIIKIFKYLCENHNAFFQTIFLRDLKFQIASDGDENKEIKFYDLMLCILMKIITLAKWESVSSTDKDIDYYFDLFYAIVELLIEIIQGTPEDNFPSLMEMKKTKKTPFIIQERAYTQASANRDKSFINKEDEPLFPIFLQFIKVILFRDESELETIYQVRKTLIDFLLAFLEEKNCPEYIQHIIVNSYNPQEFLYTITNTMKKYYFKVESQKKNRISQLPPCWKDINFSDQLTYFTGYFENLYYNTDEFSNSPEFEFANTFFRFFKLISLETNFQNDIAVGIFTKVRDIEKTGLVKSNNNNNLNNNSKVQPLNLKSDNNVFIDDNFFENYFIIQFFDSITRVVEVQLESSGTTNVIFTLPKTIKHIYDDSKEQFINSVPRETRYSKLYYMIVSSGSFMKEIEYNYNIIRHSNVLEKLRQANYYWIEFSNFLLVLACNVYMVAVIEGDRYLNGLNPHSNYIRYCEIAIIAYAFTFICSWIASKLPLNYQIEKRIYVERLISDKGLSNVKEEEIAETLSVWEKATLLLYNALFLKNEINGLIYIVILGLVGVLCDVKINFVYSLQLLIIINLSEPLKNIRISIQSRYIQLLSTLLFVIVAMYIYANIAFYFFYDSLWLSNGEERFNACETLRSCILSVILYGIRAHGGFGDIMEKPRFLKNEGAYMGRFTFDLSFYILIIVFLLNIVFGIIIDTFRLLRIKSGNRDWDINNKCFICGSTRENLEMKNQNFDDHCENKHNLWSYIYYIILLKTSNAQDLNAVNSYALDKIEKKLIGWIPSEDSIEGEAEGEEGEEE